VQSDKPDRIAAFGSGTEASLVSLLCQDLALTQLTFGGSYLHCDVHHTMSRNRAAAVTVCDAPGTKVLRNAPNAVMTMR
jgi:hypothetical protein